MIGKVDPELLRRLVFDRNGAPDDRVLQGAAYGEDTAAIEFGDEILVVNADPISLAVERLGTLAVAVAGNDVAASGGTPEWMTNVLFLPDADESILDTITRQLDREARRLGISIVGGHTEYLPALSTPLLVSTCFGLAERYVPTGGAQPGDRILLTKGAAIEGTAILSTDFRDQLADDVPAQVFERAETFYDEIGVVTEASILAPYANSMHDPTEGGLAAGLYEVAASSGVELDVDPTAIPIRDETAQLCAAAGVDPLRIFGSGALIATLPEAPLDDVRDELEDSGISTAVIGTVRETDTPRVRLGETTVSGPIRDEMYALWE